MSQEGGETLISVVIKHKFCCSFQSFITTKQHDLEILKHQFLLVMQISFFYKHFNIRPTGHNAHLSHLAYTEILLHVSLIKVSTTTQVLPLYHHYYIYSICLKVLA